MDLQALREQINSIDDQLVQLITRRMGISEQVAEYKRQNHMPVLDSSRERQIIQRLCEKAGPGNEMDIMLMYNQLFELSRSRQSRLLAGETALSAQIDAAVENTPALFPRTALVACQGVEGSYAQAAADKLFTLPNIMYFSRFEGVFSAVEKGMCRYGVLPIENSSAGSVTEVYDLMKAHSFHIVRSVKLRVSHQLCVLPGVKMSGVREIVSHEMAIRQCSGFLSALPSNVKVTAVENTAVAARMVAQSGRRDLAAIASEPAAKLYALEVINDSLQNSQSNYTRFICISRDRQIFPGASRISIMTSLPHVAGSLHRTIAKFAVLGMNLVKIESRPIPGKDFEFMFYFEFEGSVADENVKRLLSDLDAGSDQFTFLGNYSEVV